MLSSLSLQTSVGRRELALTQPVRDAGLAPLRQHPKVASGVKFMTLKDEE